MRTRITLALLTATAALLVAGCGGSDSSGSGGGAGGNAQAQGNGYGAPGGNGPRNGGPGGFAQSKKVTACLKKQGVTLPGRGRGGPPPQGQGTDRQSPPPQRGQGGAAPGGRRPGGNSAQAKKMQKALKKCGVTRTRPGAPPAGGQAQPAPPAPSSDDPS